MWNGVRRNFGANIKTIKNRIKSVKNIEKITKAMKMVAASKMRNDLSRLSQGGKFGHQMAANWFEYDLYARNFLPVFDDNTKTLLVPLTSDRGLCGGVNSTIVRQIKHICEKNRQRYVILCVGEKGTAALTRPFPDLLFRSLTEIATPVNYNTAACLSNQIEEAQIEKECERVELVFNKFKSAISSIVTRVEIMGRAAFRKAHYHSSAEVDEPDYPMASEIFYELYFSSSLYHALLNSAASEQSARMAAMENASKNAAEMVGKLDLQYNKARQTKITTELCEIISGAAAL